MIKTNFRYLEAASALQLIFISSNWYRAEGAKPFAQELILLSHFPHNYQLYHQINSHRNGSSSQAAYRMFIARDCDGEIANEKLNEQEKNEEKRFARLLSPIETQLKFNVQKNEASSEN